MKFRKANDISGTSLRGTITIGYLDLVKVFGPPHSNGDGYKVDAEWDLRFSDGTIATIYNWKDGKNYCGDEGECVENIRDWHIGGKDYRAVEYVFEALGF